MSDPPSFRCRCGAFHMDIPGGSANSGVRIQCYCRDCRAFARHTGAEDQLLPGGGLDVFITCPDRLRITRGAEHLRCLRLAPVGLERWVTACCNSPVASHVPGWALMAGVTATQAKDPGALGPVRGVYCAGSALAGQGAPQRDRGINRLKLTVLGWSLVGLVTGYHKRDPFWRDGAPIVAPQVLDPDQRAALYR